MIANMFTEIVVMASDDDGLAWLLAAGPAGAAATYYSLYRYYRNNDKSHAFERDTLIEAQSVKGEKEKIKHISRTTDSNIDGDNSDKHRKRVDRVNR